MKKEFTRAKSHTADNLASKPQGSLHILFFGTHSNSAWSSRLNWNSDAWPFIDQSN
jgi:hypothetical protein